MYRILKEQYDLRGWNLLPYAVTDRNTHQVFFVDRKTFDALELCNGRTDLSLPVVPQYIRDTVEELEKHGIVIPCSSGAALEERQKYRRYPNRYMHSVHWSVTGRCNCRCRHCYLSAADARYGELSHEDAMKIIDGFGECGIQTCSITGGEALVRPDFWEIIDRITGLGIGIDTVYSNGLMVNERLLSGFEQRRLYPEFNMSFDGLGHHDWLRGVDGAEKAVRRAFELCRDRGFPAGAEMCLWKENAHAFRDSINYLASVGCRSLKTNPVGDTGAWHEGGYAAEHGLSTEEIFGIYYRYLDDFYDDLPQMRIHLGGFFAADGAQPDTYHLPAVHVETNPGKACICSHARSTMYISPEGRALTCMPLSNQDEFQAEYPLVQEIGLQACLNDSRYMELINTRVEDVLAHNEKCASCGYRNICLGGCRAAGLLHHPGDILAPDETGCEFFRGGWTAKIEDKVGKLRPSAECAERKLLRKSGREGELWGNLQADC